MELFMIISNMIIPVVILGVVCFGVSRRVQVYDAFIEGANSGFRIVVKIMPTMVALMIAVGILRASGFLDMMASQIGRLTDQIGFPGELVPLTVVKMFSSSAATGLLLDIFKEFGTDGKGDEDEVYPGRGPHRHICRAGRQRGAGRGDGGVEIMLIKMRI